jgi:hypothetical protein
MFLANHQRPIPAEPPRPVPPVEAPELLTAGIARTPDGKYHVVAIKSRGDRITERKIIESDAHRPHIENVYRQFTILNILDRVENP